MAPMMQEGEDIKDMPKASSIFVVEQHSRYVLAAPWTESKRVLDIGGRSAHGVQVLVEAGSGPVTVLSSDEALRTALGALDVKDVTVQQFEPPSPPADIPADSADFIICHDLFAYLRADASWLAHLRRILSPEGYLMVAVPNASGRHLAELGSAALPDSDGYEVLWEQLAEQFGEGSLFGQSPVVGHLFYDFGSEEEDPDPSYDRSLVLNDDEEPGWYVLLFGPERLGRDDYALVQLDMQTALTALQTSPPAHRASQARAESTQQPEAQEIKKRDDALEEQVAQLTAKSAELTKHVDQLEQQYRKTHSRAQQQEAALAKAQDALKNVEHAAQQTQDELVRTQAALQRAQVQAAAAQSSQAALQKLEASLHEAHALRSLQERQFTQREVTLQGSLKHSLGALARQEQELVGWRHRWEAADSALAQARTEAQGHRDAAHRTLQAHQELQQRLAAALQQRELLEALVRRLEDERRREQAYGAQLERQHLEAAQRAAHLQQELRALSEEVHRVKTQAAEAEAAWEQAEHSAQQAQTTCKELEETIQELEAQKQAQGQQLESLQERATQLQNALENAESVRSSVQEELAQQQQTVAELREERAAFDSKHHAAVEQFEQRIAELASELEGARQEIAERQRTAEKELQDAEARAHAAEEKLQEADQRVQAVEARLEQIEADAQAVGDKFQKSEAKAQAAEEKLQQAEATAQATDEKLQQAEARAQAADEKLQQAEARAQAADEKLQQAEEERRTANEKRQQAEASAQAADEKLQQAAEAAQTAEERATQHEATAQQLLQEKQVLEGRLQEAEARFVQFEQTIREERQSLQGQLSDALTQIQKLEQTANQEKETLRRELTAEVERLLAGSGDYAALAEHCARLEKTNASQRNDIESFQVQLQDLMEETAQLRLQLNTQQAPQAAATPSQPIAADTHEFVNPVFGELGAQVNPTQLEPAFDSAASHDEKTIISRRPEPNAAAAVPKPNGSTLEDVDATLDELEDLLSAPPRGAQGKPSPD